MESSMMLCVIAVVTLVLGGTNGLPRRDYEFSNDILLNDYESNSIPEHFDELTSNELPTYHNQQQEQQEEEDNYFGEQKESVKEEAKETEDGNQVQVDALEEERNKNMTEMYKKDPCSFQRCTGGAMCVVTSLENSTTECVCPESCAQRQDRLDAVCSVEGEEYASKCHLHMAACEMGKNIEIAYETACIAQSRTCTAENMELFPARFLDWSLMVRDEALYGEANIKLNLVDLPDGAQSHIAKWMFDQNDMNKNLQLDPEESLQLKMYLISVEHCIESFLKDCDTDKDGSIQLLEWKMCLLPGSNSVEDDFFDNL